MKLNLYSNLQFFSTRCHYCPKTFRVKKSLLQHLEKFHQDTSGYTQPRPGSPLSTFKAHSVKGNGAASPSEAASVAAASNQQLQQQQQQQPPALNSLLPQVPLPPAPTLTPKPISALIKQEPPSVPTVPQLPAHLSQAVTIQPKLPQHPAVPQQLPSRPPVSLQAVGPKQPPQLQHRSNPLLPNRPLPAGVSIVPQPKLPQLPPTSLLPKLPQQPVRLPQHPAPAPVAAGFQPNYLKTAAGSRVVNCPDCGKTFSRQSILNVHSQMVHGSSPGQSTAMTAAAAPTVATAAAVTARIDPAAVTVAPAAARSSFSKVTCRERNLPSKPRPIDSQ